MVTGGRGFAGAWLSKALLERGDDVVCFDRTPLPDGRPSTLGILGLQGDVVDFEGDLRDAEAVNRAVSDNNVDSVFHLAAQVLVQTAAASPEPTFDTNVRGTWMLLEACRENGVERVVVASSDKAYGAHEELPYREDFALQPTAPYEASKSAADLIARSYWPSYGLPVAVTRFANLYGGGDTNWSRLVPEAVTAALDGRRPVLRSDGSPERDFLYIEDAAQAYLTIADALDRDDIRGEAFNAGGGAPYAVGDVVRLITELAGTGVEPDIQGEGNPEGEIDRQYVDPAKLLERTGWAPVVALEEGLRLTVEWYREHADVRPPS
jgi:CDP-glucose 4,6-dehydratase